MTFGRALRSRLGGDHRGAFRFLAPLLVGAGYDVAAMDVRGHGDSSAGWPRYGRVATGEDVLALVEHLGAPATVIGHSAGASAAVSAQREAPELIDSIVLVGRFITPVRMSPSGDGVSVPEGPDKAGGPTFAAWSLPGVATG